ncbi:MAG: hypothetical protein CMI95_02385 [Pelagibacteraceae bacterium]|nr:hypothetical protein [Pelagibacteraceae bacterium]|tara:strand:+ start:33228 stop:33542 length:315 start_codon:yes stop_codon:yes gene_type:complete
MNKSILFKNKLYSFFFLVLSFSVFIYLMYHLTMSKRGLFQYMILNNTYNDKYSFLTELQNHSSDLKTKINKLKLSNIDLDYLEELLRKNEGHLEKNEVVIIFQE